MSDAPDRLSWEFHDHAVGSGEAGLETDAGAVNVVDSYTADLASHVQHRSFEGCALAAGGFESTCRPYGIGSRRGRRADGVV